MAGGDTIAVAVGIAVVRVRCIEVLRRRGGASRIERVKGRTGFGVDVLHDGRLDSRGEGGG